MRCVLCISYSPELLPGLLQHLADTYCADMLLSMPPYVDDNLCTHDRSKAAAPESQPDSHLSHTAGSPPASSHAAQNNTVPCNEDRCNTTTGNTTGNTKASAGNTSHPMAESKFIVGISPYAALRPEKDTPREELHSFCYDGQEPVIGYLSYTYGLLLHGVQSTKSTSFPLGLLRRYRYIIEGDSRTGALRLLVSDILQDTTEADTDKAPLPGPSVSELIQLLKHTNLPPVRRHVPFTSGAPIRQSQSRSEYLEGVRQTRARIQAGDTYQLNLSIRFDLQVTNRPDTTALFLHLWQQRPAPFYALLHDGPHTVISTSPERFLQVRERAVLTQPIKGTLAFDAWDETLVEKLTSSPKERAELSMIVDLLRNDISAHCEFGSVRVEDHCSTFTVDRLIQMYTNVRGTLCKESSPLDLLLDAFPGGSITGCPKLRTMQIIDALEPHSRDLYCGSIFYVNGRDYLDSSIAIRTGWYNAENDSFSWFAGSGLVIDSVPESEYDETIAKARKFQEALQP